jgi:cytochrome P450
MVAQLLPPGPKGRFLTGNLFDYSRDQLGYLTRCAREYGDMVGLRFVNVRSYLLNRPEYAEYVLVRSNRGFIKSRGERHSLGFLGSGLLTSEGPFWRRQRRLAQPTFHRERVSAYGGVMVERAEQTISAWRNGEVRDVHQDMARLALEIAAETLFGTLSATGFEKVGAALAVIAARFTGRGGVLFQVPESIPTPGNLRFRRDRLRDHRKASRGRRGRRFPKRRPALDAPGGPGRGDRGRNERQATEGRGDDHPPGRPRDHR